MRGRGEGGERLSLRAAAIMSCKLAAVAEQAVSQARLGRVVGLVESEEEVVQW